MIICKKTYNAALFDWKKKTPSAEASTLGLDNFEQIYDDACDVGIMLENPKTNTKAAFFLCETIMTEDEIDGWRLRSIPEHVKKNPRLKDIEIIIWND
jgi:F0F1-type ATP synthase delta subunit